MPLVAPWALCHHGNKGLAALSTAWRACNPHALATVAFCLCCMQAQHALLRLQLCIAAPGRNYQAPCRFFARPKKTITKTEYSAQAKEIALRAQNLAREAKELRNEENASGRSRKWRSETKELGKRLSLLEDDEKQLEKQYPQVRS